jgi:polyisoprenoid-binding protein YceI
MKKFLVSALALTAVACSQGGESAPEAATSPVGEWSVDSDQSRLAFVTVKSGEMAESSYFETLGGGVTSDGEAQITIDLASVQTRNETRDPRMREILFKVATYPQAIVSAQLDPAEFESLEVDERRVVPLDFELDLHGAQVPFLADVFVTRISNDAVLVESVEPIAVFADDFGLVPALEELQALAQLPSIAPVSPVTFSVLFTR